MAKITDAGLALIAQLQAAEDTLVIDKMIYANINGLDPDMEPPGTETMPDAGDIVRESVIADAGYIDPNTVVYSDVLDSEIGDFFFNWIGLYCSEFTTLVAVTYVPLQSKRATAGFNTGNTICKNFAISYNDIQDLTGIVIEAEAWQQDFSGLYAPLDHNHDEDYAPLDHNHDGDYAAIDHTHPGKTVSAWGTVKSDGTKLCGSTNWTVARNEGGQYQLNITDAGDYLVIVNHSSSYWGELMTALHDDTTGIFNNNVSGNIRCKSDAHTENYTSDASWVFFAVKL